ncbi:hypothetical protein LZ30DRAFT_782938 [Colletotrichum cereale]|nr:hypothetical protein LZ30DRAFT_782938 [Colletotrichum cereale]
MPTASQLDVRSAPAGDGYYHVTPNDDGTSTTSFVPLADILNVTGITARDVTPSAPGSLQKRDGVTCTRIELNVDDTLNSQQCLRNAADNERSWGKGHWAFCKIGGTMAYACAYQDVKVNSQIINNFQVTVDNQCGWPVVGFQRCTNNCAVSDLAVGRTSSGNSFCTSGFVGW